MIVRILAFLLFLAGPALAQTPPNPPVVARAAGTTSAVVATMPALAGVTNWICGFDISAIGGTAAVSPVTVAGIVGGSLIYNGLTSSASGINFNPRFWPCIPASAANTAITITTTAAAGATAVNVNAFGFTAY